MPRGEPSLVLPFAVVERDGQPAEEFPFDVAIATVLADLETRRDRAGVLSRREEAVEFASLVYWPMIIVPWREDRRLVFDGMGIWSYVFSIGKISDARAFAASLDGAADSAALVALLQSQPAFFADFADHERVPIMGLLLREELTRHLLAHAPLAKSRPLGGNGLLVPRITPDQAQEAVHRIRSLLDRIAADKESLAIAARALEKSGERVRDHVAALRGRTREAYADRIDGIRPEVTARVTLLETEREERWAAAQPKLLDLQAAVRKAEASVEHWDLEAKTNYGPERNDAVQHLAYARGELEWAHEEAQRYERGMAQAREGFDREIQAQWERIRELERERDAEVARLDQEERAAAQLVAKFTDAVALLVRRLDEAAESVVSQGLPAPGDGVTIVRLPVFVASLIGERGRRFIVVPPMVARGEKGVLGSLKSTLGGIVLPLESKDQGLDGLFRGAVERALALDPSLAAYLASVGSRNNLFHLANLRELVGRGLAALRAQGWIRDRQERELVQALQRHIALAAPTAPLIEP